MTGVLTFLKNIFRINPIIVKEIRSRMRGPRAFITLTAILLVMGGLMYAMLQIILANARFNTVLSPQIGQGLFAALAFLELFMICAVTPSVTAGAVSGEKEKQTYEMLMATPLSPTSILWGKLISALSYVLLLLFAGIPLASVVFIFGGVSPADMFKALLVLLGTAVAFGILGLFMSALFGRTGRATVASFVVVALLMIGPIFMAGLIAILRNGTEPPRWILAPSPISALSAALASSMSANGSYSVFSVLGGIFGIGVNPVSQTSIPRPIYHYSLAFYAVLSLVLYMLTARLVQPTRRWRLRWKQVLVAVGSVLLLLGLIAGGYFATARRYEWMRNPQAAAPTMAPVIAVPVPDKVVVKPVEVQPNETTTPTPTPASPPTKASSGDSAIDETGSAEIYAAVARQLYGPDNTFGGKTPGWEGLYLISNTNDSVGDPNAAKEDPVSLSKGICSDVAIRLNNLPVKVMWIESRDKAPINADNGTVDNGKSAIITFGNIHVQPDGSVQVSASLYFGNLGGTGKTYILKQVDGVWTITGTTGVEWIS